jgi:soluble lytic murein transglycosylase
VFVLASFFVKTIFLILSFSSVKATSFSKKEMALLEKYYAWKACFSPKKSAQEILDFLFDNSGFPLFRNLVIKAENLLNPKKDNSFAIKWFVRYPPLTANGTLVFADELLKKDKKLAEKFIKQTWIHQNMTASFAKKFKKTFHQYISIKDDALRITELIEKKNNKQLEYMKGLVPRVLAAYLSRYLAKVSRSDESEDDDMDDPDIRYHYTQQCIDKKEYTKAAFILSKTNNGEDSTTNGFYQHRQIISAALLRQGKFQLAYQVLSLNKLNRFNRQHRRNVAKAEWFLGFIAFRFLGLRSEAIEHFQTSYEMTKDSVKRARSAFWLGEVYRDINDFMLAFDWYKKASAFSNSFYGQLALTKMYEISSGQFSIIAETRLYNSQVITNAESRLIFENRELVQILKVVFKEGLEKNPKFILPFYKQLMDDMDDPEEERMLVDMAKDSTEVEFLFQIEANKQKYINDRKAYKTLPDAKLKFVKAIKDDTCFISLVHAVIQQESRFKERAESHCGATGLMQVMPKTAEYEMKRIKTPYLRQIVTLSLFDPPKNLSIGSFILKRLLKKYKGNVIFVAASYNAGEGNIDPFIKSIKKFKNTITPVDIIELIPIKETRLYVKYVINNLLMYQRIFRVAPCYNWCSLSIQT